MSLHSAASGILLVVYTDQVATRGEARLLISSSRSLVARAGRNTMAPLLAMVQTKLRGR